MPIYLDHALAERRAEVARAGRAFTRADLDAAIMVGAVERVRPKMMTVVAIMVGLLPILWAHGTGSEVMSRIAVPMIGGIVSSTILTLVVIPAVYALVKGYGFRQRASSVTLPPILTLPVQVASQEGEQQSRCRVALKCGTRKSTKSTGWFCH